MVLTEWVEIGMVVDQVGQDRRGDVKVRTNQRNGGNEWDHALAHFNLRSWTHFITHPNFVDSLGI